MTITMSAAQGVARTRRTLVMRRRELYRRAAPLFRRYGYRQVTLKALATACHLSPPALYHYFPSKRAFALFPLDDANGFDDLIAERTRHVVDPLERLRVWIDLAIEEQPHVVLALRLANEISLPAVDMTAPTTMINGRRCVGELILGVAPHVGRERAEETADLLLRAAIADAATGAYVSTEILLRHLMDATRGALAAEGVETARLDGVLTPRANLTARAR